MIPSTRPIVRARASSIQTPVLGWNARDSQDNMKPGFALQLDNIFPQPNYVQLRNGHVQYCPPPVLNDTHDQSSFVYPVARVAGELVVTLNILPATAASNLPPVPAHSIRYVLPVSPVAQY